MLCEVIAYILSWQRLSAKTFVTGCVFYALQDRLSLWVLCDTSGVGERSGVLSTGSPFGHHPRLRMVCPLWGQWVRAGRFLFSLPLHSPSPLSTLHSPLSTSPRVHPSGITRGYAWCVPAGDCEWTMSYFFSYQEKQILGRNVFSHSCGLICCAQKYNKGVS